MKSTKLRINKKTRLSGIRKLEGEINEIIKDALDDIRWYLKKDIVSYLKKKGIIVYAKTQKAYKKKIKKTQKTKTKK